jgi:hypothetical protein
MDDHEINHMHHKLNAMKGHLEIAMGALYELKRKLEETNAELMAERKKQK